MGNAFFDEIVYEKNRNLAMIDRLIHWKREIGVFGAGGYADTLISELRGLGINVDYCVIEDKYWHGDGNLCNGVEVYSIEKCNQIYMNSLMIIGFGMNYHNEEETQKRIRKEVDTSIEIIDFEDQYLGYFYYFDYDYFLKNRGAFYEMYNMLSDERSKDLFIDYVNGRIKGDLHNMVKYQDNLSMDYDLQLLLQNQRRGTIIDCGAYDGVSAVQLAEATYGRCKIIAFEPDCKNYTIMKDRVQNINCIYTIQKGVWSKSAKLNLNGSGQSANLGDKCDIEEGVSIDTCAIDDMKVERVAAIIMDIEGAEVEALKGAAETIARDMPALAIRCYHRQDDFVMIPLFFKKFGLDKKFSFYLRYDGHYRGASDLTFYAI